MKIKLSITSNSGYAPSQVRNSITVGQLRSYLEDFDDDDEIVLEDAGNRYGAKFGKIWDEYPEECTDDDED